MWVPSPQRTETSWHPAGTKLWVLAVAVLGQSWHDVHSWDMHCWKHFPGTQSPSHPHWVGFQDFPRYFLVD